MQSFARLSKQQGILLLATGFIEDKEKEFFLKEGFDIYSFYEIFKEKDMREYGYNPDNTTSHFNAQGCYIIGKALAEHVQTCRHDRLLLGKQGGKEIFCSLPELEVLVSIQDQRLHECLCLLTTRFPDGFEG